MRLVDDELATSLASGGRLDVLLSAVDFAVLTDTDRGEFVAALGRILERATK